MKKQVSLLTLTAALLLGACSTYEEVPATLRDVSYKGAPAGTVKAADTAAEPAAPSANGTTDNTHH